MEFVPDPSDPLPPISINAKRLREERGWTLKEAAEVSGVSFQLISMLENGTRPNPSLDTLLGLAHAYGVPIDSLVTDGGAPLPSPLVELIDSGLIGDVDTRELMLLRGATGLLGRDLSREDYYDLVRLIRAKRP